jgi:glucose-1-phosphate thymidylyltransferase
MNVLLPMAGFGTRLRPLTWSKPKPLVPVAGQPVLGHVLDMFDDLPDVKEVVFIVGYLGDQVQAYVQRAYPRLTARYVEQREMLGQSHALWLAREFLHGPVLLLFVDTLIETDLRRAIGSGEAGVAWVKAVDDPRRFGVAEVGEGGWVRRLVEKPADRQNNLVVVGCYYLPQGEALAQAIEEQMKRNLHLNGEFFLVDALNLMLERGLKMRVEPVEVWEDCGKPDALLHTNRYLLDHGRENSASASAARPGVVVVPPVFVDPAARIERAVIGPYASLAAGCVVEDSVVRDSVVDEEAEISGAVLSGSLVGRQARIRGGFRSMIVGDSSEVGFE